MKVLEEKIEGGKSRKEVLQTGKKKYTRTTNERGVDWRRYKTNHQVKRGEFDNLESDYNSHFRPHFVPDGFIKPEGLTNVNGILVPIYGHFVDGTPVMKDDRQRVELERGIVRVSNNGASKLAAVKYIKDMTGWGLKDSKKYFEVFFERRDKNNKGRG